MKEVLKPKAIDKITAVMEPRTVKTPFTPYIHGINFSRLFCFNICMPVGNGMPSKKPRGNIKKKQTIER